MSRWLRIDRESARCLSGEKGMGLGAPHPMSRWPLVFPKNDLPSEETLTKIADYSLVNVNAEQVPFW